MFVSTRTTYLSLRWFNDLKCILLSAGSLITLGTMKFSGFYLFHESWPLLFKCKIFAWELTELYAGDLLAHNIFLLLPFLPRGYGYIFSSDWIHICLLNNRLNTVFHLASPYTPMSFVTTISFLPTSFFPFLGYSLSFVFPETHRCRGAVIRWISFSFAH